MQPEGAPLTRRDRIDRSRSRSWALQVLYRWESEGGEGDPANALASTLRSRRVAPRRLPMVERLLDTVGAHLDEIDGAILGAMENWRLERLSRIDRSVLRLATGELLYHDDVPGPVVIQEAIRMAGQYGGNESPRFVNGVLDAILRRYRENG